MKPLLILLLAPGIALASPPELKDLQAKRAAKIAEIDRIYASELEKLQEKLMRRGDLAGANKVEEEIRKVVKDPFGVDLEGVWVYSVPGGKETVVKFSRDGRAVDDKGRVVWPKWSIEGGILTITYPDSGACVFDMRKQAGGLVEGRTSTGLVRTLKPSSTAE